MMDFGEFASFLKTSFPEVTEEQMERFRLMDGGYREWNAKINVISRKDIDGLYDHHVLHSLAIAEYLRINRPEEFFPKDRQAAGGKISVLDLGTGGGFPGIPLAVMFPHVQFTLCDSIGKKTVVAREIASLLGLTNVEVINARGESIGGKFDFIVSRAVASLVDFYPWVKGKYSQSVIFLKGGDLNEEISALMCRWNLKKGSVSTWPVDSWLKDEYFSGKFVVEIR